MLDFSVPAGFVEQKQAVTRLWRGLVQVLNAAPVAIDPTRALLEPGPHGAHTVRKVMVPLGDHATPGRLFMPQGGTGAAVVIAHGTTAVDEGPYFMWIRALLAEKIAVMTFALDGHGGNPRELRTPGIEENMPAAIAFLREQPEIDPARLGLMGVSLGGACAVAAAAADPRIKAVVSVSAPHRINIDEWGKLGEAIGLFNPEVAPAYLEASPNFLMGFMSNTLRIAPEPGIEPGDLLSAGTKHAVARALRHLNPLDAAGQLGHSPLLVINGEWDFIAPPWQAWALHERAAGVKAIEIVPRRNHFTVMVSPRAVEAMAAWFRRFL